MPSLASLFPLLSPPHHLISIQLVHRHYLQHHSIPLLRSDQKRDSLHPALLHLASPHSSPVAFLRLTTSSQLTSFIFILPNITVTHLSRPIRWEIHFTQPCLTSPHLTRPSAAPPHLNSPHPHLVFIVPHIKHNSSSSVSGGDSLYPTSPHSSFVSFLHFISSSQLITFIFNLSSITAFHLTLSLLPFLTSAHFPISPHFFLFETSRLLFFPAYTIYHLASSQLTLIFYHLILLSFQHPTPLISFCFSCLISISHLTSSKPPLCLITFHSLL